MDVSVRRAIAGEYVFAMVTSREQLTRCCQHPRPLHRFWMESGICSVTSFPRNCIADTELGLDGDAVHNFIRTEKMPSGPSHFTMPPPTTSTDLKVSFPEEHVLLLTLNRPEKRNAMSPSLSQEIGKVLAWFDEEPSLWCVRAFLSLRGLFIECDILTFYAWGMNGAMSVDDAYIYDWFGVQGS